MFAFGCYILVVLVTLWFSCLCFVWIFVFLVLIVLLLVWTCLVAVGGWFCCFTVTLLRWCLVSGVLCGELLAFGCVRLRAVGVAWLCGFVLCLCFMISWLMFAVVNSCGFEFVAFC